MVASGPALTYLSWEERSNALARGLAARGVEQGDRVALVFDNARWTEFAVSYLGILKAGAIAVPLGSRLTTREISDVFDHCMPVAVVAPSDLAPALPVPAREPADLEHGEEGAPFSVRLDPEDLAEILYTSGTTGVPKGVAVSHGNITYGFPSEPPLGREPPPIRLLHAFALGTNAGQEVLRVPLRPGPKMAVVLPTFDADQACAVIEANRITRLHLVPSTAHILIESGAHGRHDVSSVERVMLTSAPTPPGLLPELATAFPNARVANVYTLTEAAPARTVMTFDPARPASVGRPEMGTEIRVVTRSGMDAPPQEEGEIWIRLSGAPTRHYYRDPEATAAVRRGDWLRTGDIGYVDDSGYVFLVDRVKDVIVTGGLKVASLPIENVLYEHPSILDTAVFGVSHPVSGEIVAAVVCGRKPLSEREVQSWVRQRLSEDQVPRRVFFVDHVPRNASGKVLKRQLRETKWPETPEEATTAATLPIERLVESVWRQVLLVESMGRNDDFFASGGHSLAAMEAISILSERLERKIEVTAIFRYPTVAEFAGFLLAGIARSG